jgi:hypothetical protein
VDIGLYRNGGNLDITVRPQTDFNGIFSAVVFTIRWDRSTGATLGDLVQEGAPAQYIPIAKSGNVHEVGAMNYQVYAGFGTMPMGATSWQAGKEYVIASIPTTGKADFELVNDPWTQDPANNASYYLSLGGVDRTGIIYKGLATGDEDGTVVIQPNPNNGIFTFSFNVAAPMDITVEVVNTLGQSVFTDVQRSFEGTYRRDMNLTTMSNGVYYLKIKRGELSSTHKIVYR